MSVVDESLNYEKMVHTHGTYQLSKVMPHGNYDFTLCDIITGLPPDSFLTMQIALTIEFIEEI